MKGMCGATVGTVVKTSGMGNKNLGEGKCDRRSKRSRDKLREGKTQKGGEARGNGSNRVRGRGHATRRTRGAKDRGGVTKGVGTGRR